MTSPDTVLVTGGSGYLAGWVIAGLLERGYPVRATLRSLARATALRDQHGANDASLRFVAADLTADAGWDEAMSGVRHVIHTATPMMAKGDALLVASAGGTRRVMEAAARAGVERIVVTSSGYAAQRPRGPRDVVQQTDETVWADPMASGLNEYARAKTLAERDAWASAAAHPGLHLSTVLPGFILGPVQSAAVSPSMGLIAMMLKGTVPAVPNLGMSIVDVRDAADLHIRALLAPEAKGERFLASAGFLWFREIADLLRRELGAEGSKAPKRTMPDLLTHALALVSPTLRELAPNLGRRSYLDSSKALTLLGWTPRPVEQTIVDGARSLIAHGAFAR